MLCVVHRSKGTHCRAEMMDAHRIDPAYCIEVVHCTEGRLGVHAHCINLRIWPHRHPEVNPISSVRFRPSYICLGGV